LFDEYILSKIHKKESIPEDTKAIEDKTDPRL
jgi:hypothetical protein